MTAVHALPDDRSSEALVSELIAHGRELAQQGWVPATSGNFSRRRDADHVFITVSGADKGRLTPDDVMVVDVTGKPVGSARRPSAETLLHTQLYRRFPEVGAVLHTHSLVQTVASRVLAAQERIRLEGYELLKALEGMATHEATIELPVFANSQDIPALAAEVEEALDRDRLWGYLIAGHGLYAWGRDVTEARRHLDAFEFLLACELEQHRIMAGR